MSTNTSPINAARPSDRLWSKGFVALLITQFMVALNDNIFRWLVIPIGKWAVGWSDKQDSIRTIGSLAFLIPFLLFTTYAGYVCDRFDRRKVMIGSKIAELLIMLLGTAAILSQSVPFLLITLFLMATQSAFFSPAKYGSLPNLVPKERISEANGYVTMTTMIACIGGQALGGFLFVWTTLHPEAPVPGTGGMSNWAIWASAILGVAAIGLVSSFFIPSIPAADPSAKFPLNPFAQTYRDLGTLFQHKFLFWVALASSFFWGLGAMAQLNIDKFATEFLRVRQDDVILLLGALSLGIAVGSFLAGKISRGRVELGLVPIGALLIVVFCGLTSLTKAVVLPEGVAVASVNTPNFWFGSICLFGLGLSAGMFDLPLVTTLQTRSPEERRGRIIAAYNFYSFATMAIFSAILLPLASPTALGLKADKIWLVCGLISVPVVVAAICGFALDFIRFGVGTALRLFYGLREYDVDNIPEKGPALLVGNHVTYLDALIVYCASKRPVRFIADQNFLPLKSRLANFVIRKTGVIQIVPGDRRSIVAMLKASRAALDKGEVVCIFAEGALTRDGQTRAFAPGFLGILKNREDVPVIPFCIAGFYGSRWGYAKPKNGKGGLRYRPTVSFGKPFDLAAARARGWSDAQVSQRLLHAVQELDVDARSFALHPENIRFLPPTRQAIRALRTFGGKLRLADSTGKETTGRQTLLQILVLRRVFKRTLGDEKFVGVLLPTSVVGVLTNAAVAFANRVPVNINYTFTNEINDYCIKKVGIKKILTTRLLLNKLPKLKLNAELLILEELAKTTLKTSDKLIGFLQSLLPTCVLERVVGLTKQKLDDVNTVVFTSGSTGMPKGTILTNLNIVENGQSFGQTAQPFPNERLLGVLPFFHSFGYSVTTWFPLTHPYSCVYHYNPLDYRGVAAIARKYRPTVFISTPTFLRTYLRRCEKEDFASCVYTIPGAEKTPKELFDGWREKFGFGLSEGFGATELSPVLSENLAEDRIPDPFTPYRKEGSIGRANPGFVAKVVDMETGEELPPNESGMLLVKGNSVTPGYFEDPEQTAKIFRDGWYVTGDVAKIDEDNFIFITGRETRISKIGGEMAPHALIEERLVETIRTIEKEQAQTATGANASNDGPAADSKTIASNDDGDRVGPNLVVTAVPDEKKGEKLVVLYVSLPATPEEICKRASETGLPQLWIPASVNFKRVDEIPILGTGKLNLKAIKDLALKIYDVRR